MNGMTAEEARALTNLVSLVDAMERRLTQLHEAVLKLEGRQLWMDSGDDIWHHHEGRMYPLTNEGEHVDVRSLRHRDRRVGPVLGMQKADNFPTFEQVDRLHGNLKRCTELDVVKRHVRRLETQLSEVAGQVS